MNPTQPDNSTAHPLEIPPGSNLGRRHRLGKLWRLIFLASTLVGILSLITLLLNILNDSMGYVAYEVDVDPASLSTSSLPLEQLSKDELVAILRQNISANAYNTLETLGSWPTNTRSIPPRCLPAACPWSSSLMITGGDPAPECLHQCL